MKSLILAAAFAMFILPAPLVAQAEAPLGPSKCEWKCFCGDDGCGCNKGTPGTGGKSCSADDGCWVAACDAAAVLLFQAADGGFAPVSRSSVPGSTLTAGSQAEWGVDAAGRSVLRTCEGIIIAQKFDPGLADHIRQLSSQISI